MESKAQAANSLLHSGKGAGNDFLLVDLRAGGLELTPAFVAALCDRRRGIGADGMMALETDDTADCRMRFFNSDGSRAAMCGNGSRCFALFACHVGAAAERIAALISSVTWGMICTVCPRLTQSRR